MKKIILGFVFLLGMTTHVYANENNNFEYPFISGDILTEFTTDFMSEGKYKVRNDDKRTNSFFIIEPDFKVNLNERWLINTQWLIRPVEDRVYQGSGFGDSSAIVGGNSNSDYYGKENRVQRKIHTDDYGILIEKMSLDFKAEDAAFGFGKFSPSFGKAFEKNKFHGVYGHLMPLEYELKEKIGGYITAIFDSSNIRLNLFFDDRTDLSRSSFRDRGRDKSYGGSGNTGRLNSYSITWEGENFFKVDNLDYNLGYRNLKTQRFNEDDEEGYLLGLKYTKEFDNNIIFIPFTEFAVFDNFDGMRGRDLSYYTVSLPVVYKGWNFVTSETIKQDKETNYKKYTSYLRQYSAGYKFNNGVMFDVARKEYKNTFKVNDSTVPYKTTERENGWGIMLSYMYKF